MKLHPALLLCAGLSLLAGCADMQQYFDSTPAQPHPRAQAVLTAPAHEPAALREGIKLYDEGDYNAAIRKLASRDIANGPVSARVTALKYTAFSYCVTSRPAQCQQAFEKALRLDPRFELSPGEHGHPLWGPVFAKARNAR
ncbi:MAG: TssQ family T6SS-associated lipoprotein [Telluria sp.]